MFEFHGWAVIRVAEEDHAPVYGGDDREEQVIRSVRAAVAEIRDRFSILDVSSAGNGLIVLYAHGLRNHCYAPVVELFRWIAAQWPNAYGLLYIHDDEDSAHDNEFRVWRLARGVINEQADPFLSPYIPTVEPPYDPKG